MKKKKKEKYKKNEKRMKKSKNARKCDKKNEWKKGRKEKRQIGMHADRQGRGKKNAWKVRRTKNDPWRLNWYLSIILSIIVWKCCIIKAKNFQSVISNIEFVDPRSAATDGSHESSQEIEFSSKSWIICLKYVR